MSKRMFTALDEVFVSSTSSSSSQKKSNPFEDSLNEVAKDFGRSILLRSFSDDLSQEFVKPTEIQRNIHGLLHAVRVAIFILMMLNLYRLLGDADALSTTKKELRMLELAAFAHDAARLKDSGEDKDEIKNAYLAIKWLKERDVSLGHIKIIANIIANKNYQTGMVWYQYNAETDLFDSLGSPPSKKEQFFSSLLNIADGLDIPRCIQKFKRELSPFPKNLFQTYQYINKNSRMNYDDAFLFFLNNEIKVWLKSQGDLKDFLSQKKKMQYEFGETYQACIDGLARIHAPILQALYYDGSLYQFSSLSTLDFFSRSLPNWEYVRGLKKIDGQYYESVFTECQFLFQEGGNKGRSIAALLPGTTRFLPVGYFVNLRSCDTRSIGRENFLSGCGEKILEPVMDQDAVDKELIDIQSEKISKAEDSYAEVVADIYPESITGFYYIPQKNSEYNTLCEAQAYYFRALFQEKTEIDLKIYQYDPLTHHRKEVRVDFVNSAQLVYEFIIKCLKELKKDNKAAKKMYGFSDRYLEVLSPYQRSLVDVFCLNREIKRWLKHEKHRVAFVFLSTKKVSRELWYMMNDQSVRQSFFYDYATRARLVVRGKYDVKLGHLLGMELLYPKDERQRLIKLEEKIRFAELEEVDHEFIFNLPNESLSELIDPIIKSKKLEKPSITLLLNRLPSISWKTVVLILKNKLYNAFELSPWINKLNELHEVNLDYFDCLDKTNPASFDLFVVFFEKFEIETFIEKGQKRLWFDFLKRGCEYFLSADSARQISGQEELQAIIAVQMRGLLNCKRYLMLTDFSAWVVYLGKHQVLLKQCHILNECIQQLELVFNDWRGGSEGLYGNAKKSERLIIDAFLSLNEFNYGVAVFFDNQNAISPRPSK